MDPCALKLDLCPVQANYSGQFAEGLISTALDGGPSWTRLDVPGAPHNVSATWVLNEADYCRFQGFHRLWARSGGEPFKIDLLLETPDMLEYEASFVPGSVRLVGVSGGRVFTVSASLEVMPAFVDPCRDYCAALALLMAAWGPDTCRVMETVARVVNSGRMNVNP